MARKPPEPALTKRGIATRQRIIEAAAALVYERGGRGTSLDEVMENSRTSKSQLYHYFANKDALLRAVIQWQTRHIIGAQRKAVPELDSMDALERWSGLVIAAAIASEGRSGCPLGSLASELADYSEDARILLGESFDLWEAEIVRGLKVMKARGELSREADPVELATATMTAMQGGKLLAQTQRSARPLRLAMEMACANIARHLTKKRKKGAHRRA